MAAEYETVINIADAAHRRGDVVIRKIVDKNTLTNKGDILVGTGVADPVNSIDVSRVSVLAVGANGMPIVANSSAVQGVSYGQVIGDGIAPQAITKDKLGSNVVNSSIISTADGFSVHLESNSDGSLSAVLDGSATNANFATYAQNDKNGKVITSYAASFSNPGANLAVNDASGNTLYNQPIIAAESNMLTHSLKTSLNAVAFTLAGTGRHQFLINQTDPKEFVPNSWIYLMADVQLAGVSAVTFDSLDLGYVHIPDIGTTVYRPLPLPNKYFYWLAISTEAGTGSYISLYASIVTFGYLNPDLSSIIHSSPETDTVTTFVCYAF